MQAAFAKILEPAFTRDNRNEGDYQGEDGLLMCGKCHTPKQTRSTVESLGIFNRIVPCICECEKEQRDREEKREKDEETRQQIEAMKDYGLDTAQYRESTFAKDDGADPKASEICRKYVENWEKMQEMGKGLLFHGDVGSGKTFLASCIANSLVERKIPALITTLAILVHKMTANFGDQRESVLRMVKTVPLLVIDDFGAEQPTRPQLEKQVEIINTRYQARKPLIITTNLSMDKIKNPGDVNYKRMYSRVSEMCPYGIRLKTANRRTAEAKESYEAMCRILGEQTTKE